MPLMMSHDKDPHGIADDAKQKVVGKAMEVHAAKVALTDGKRFGPLCRLQHEVPQLGVEVVRKLATGDALVILHDRVNIGVNLRMQDEPHQLNGL
jgi:hypothetical protein